MNYANGLIFCGARRVQRCGRRGQKLGVPGALRDVPLTLKLVVFCQRFGSNEVLIRFVDKIREQPSGWVMIAQVKLGRTYSGGPLINLPGIVRDTFGLDDGDKIGFYRSAEMMETEVIIKLMEPKSQ